MARKVFISILGTGYYQECVYVSDNFRSNPTRFAQEAIINLCNAKNWSGNDKALFCLTTDARKMNWSITERNHIKDGIVPYKGLKYVVDEMNFPFESKDIHIPDGKDETEMWEIFDTIFRQLEDNDELYIDLTHSFRYLPMLLLVLSNYAKFLKNVTIKHISYGNYEARDLQTNCAPITNLLPITILQDWTFAAADYLRNGNADRLSDLSKAALTPILFESEGKDAAAVNLRRMIQLIQLTTEDFQTCRGMNIINSTHISKLKELLEKIESTFIEPLNPLINKFVEVLENFNEMGNVNNGFVAAQWCYDHGLFQQAATILQENVVSYFCVKHDIEIDDENERELINKAFIILGLKIQDDESKWILDENLKLKMKLILEDDEINNKKLYQAFSRLTELRNDINHSGMRSTRSPLKSNRIKISLAKDIELFTELLYKQTKIDNSNSIAGSLFINLTNHPFSEWDNSQKKELSQYDKCIDMAFPEINPYMTVDDIDLLAIEHLQKIEQIAKENNSKPVVHLMGEMTFLYSLVNKLRDRGIKTVASTTERISIDLGNGTKKTEFRFVRFRDYF